MRGIDEDRIGERQQLVAQRVVQHRAKLARLPPERGSQVGPPDVADKQRVPGQDRMRCRLADIQIVDGERDRFRRVSGRGDRLQPHAPELDAVAVSERRERVLRLGGAEINPRPDAIAQFQVAGDEIGVEVVEIVHRSEAVLFGNSTYLSMSR